MGKTVWIHGRSKYGWRIRRDADGLSTNQISIHPGIAQTRQVNRTAVFGKGKVGMMGFAKNPGRLSTLRLPRLRKFGGEEQTKPLAEYMSLTPPSGIAVLPQQRNSVGSKNRQEARVPLVEPRMRQYPQSARKCQVFAPKFEQRKE